MPAENGLSALEQNVERRAPSLPITSAEKANMIIHYYRGEMGRMTSWRDRIDRTTNWSITVVAALLSVSLSTPTSHHGVILFAMLLVSLLLLIEARRYRFFDVYRARVRKLERHYFAQALDPQADLKPDWAEGIARSLRNPSFHIKYRDALFRRVRRNYVWMYLILLFAWLLKISTPKLLAEQEGSEDTAFSFSEAVANAAFGPLPGWSVMLIVAVLYGAIIYAALYRDPTAGEFAHGDVHV